MSHTKRTLQPRGQGHYLSFIKLLSALEDNSQGHQCFTCCREAQVTGIWCSSAYVPIGTRKSITSSCHSRSWQEHQVSSLGLCFCGQEKTRHRVLHHVPMQPAGSQAGHLCPSGSLAASAPLQEPTNSKRHHLSTTCKRPQLPASFPACPSFPITCLSFSCRL